MKLDRSGMSVAEFLDAVADQERAQSNDVNAQVFSRYAHQAKAQELALQQTQAELHNLRDRLADIARTAKTA